VEPEIKDLFDDVFIITGIRVFVSFIIVERIIGLIAVKLIIFTVW